MLTCFTESGNVDTFTESENVDKLCTERLKLKNKLYSQFNSGIGIVYLKKMELELINLELESLLQRN